MCLCVCVCVCTCGAPRTCPLRKHQARRPSLKLAPAHPSRPCHSWRLPPSLPLAGFQLMRQTERHEEFGSSTEHLPAHLSFHFTFVKLGISYSLLTGQNSCRSDVRLSLNFNYSVVSLPSFPRRGRFFFRFLMHLNLQGCYSRRPCFKNNFFLTQKVSRENEVGPITFAVNPSSPDINRKF